MRDSSHNILTSDALQVLSSSQVTPELSMSMRIRPICKVYIHTYLSSRHHACFLTHQRPTTCSGQLSVLCLVFPSDAEGSIVCAELRTSLPRPDLYNTGWTA
jgi:hypothetical protein